MPPLHLNSSVTALTGIGAARAKLLSKLGIETIYDLIAYFPRAYEDRTKIVNICDMEVGVPACFRATVISQPRSHHIRKGMDITKLSVSDMTAKLNITFFNQPYVQDQLHYGEDYIFYGMLREDYGLQLQNPEFEPADQYGRSTCRILPIYSLTAGLNNKMMLRCIQQALDACLPSLPEILPQSVRQEYHLCDAATAYRTIHQPESFELLAQARRRLIFDEFFLFSAGLSMLRSKRKSIDVAPWKDLNISPFLNALPYSLTGAQRRVLQDIAADVTSGKPMNRLVQGDVGSGKTAVAAAAAYMAYLAGKQSAMMAPTEILAEQHYGALSTLLSPLGVEVVLLTGGLSAAEKKWVKERLATGHAKLVIGTHALLTSDVAFADLGLVITDEQHRFGVNQRAVLSEKGQHPHMLFLSATPIPRTLSLILYGDLEVSVIDELPPGRTPIETFLVGESMRQRIFAFIRKQVENGNQVYVVCPAVEESEELNLKSAEQWAQTLQSNVFPDLKVGLLHGKMKPAEKDSVMRKFSAGETQILVATTVIEVGVDVPNATLMVVEDADRFGLSQLHQLRGRVGRGKDQSYCVLISHNENPDTKARLKALCSTTDGFEIAMKDLALRGPGDFFGSRQHGLPQFKVGNLELDVLTLQQAQEATAVLNMETLRNDPAYRPLIERIRTLFSKNDVIFN